MLEDFFEIHKNVIKKIPRKIKRYLYHDIDFNLNAICIFGARGVGKTTLLLQYCLEKYDGDPERCLYISGDNVSVVAKGLYACAQEYFKYGGQTLIIDEIHKYPNWSQEVKNIIDTYKGKKILISGSSAFSLRMGKYDLSRRMVYYELNGLSFREFLNFETGKVYEKYNLNDLIKKHVKYSMELSSDMPILKYFRDYLKIGYYPFFLEGRNVFFNRLNNYLKILAQYLILNNHIFRL
ncbi:AAA family ATPase [bacterium]